MVFFAFSFAWMLSSPPDAGASSPPGTTVALRHHYGIRSAAARANRRAIRSARVRLAAPEADLSVQAARGADENPSRPAP
jgi:hypothetical protein